MIDDLYMKSPCGQCPFRKDCLKGWLGEERAEQILYSESFTCHKNPLRQCSGAMQLGPFNTFAQIGLRLGQVELKGADKLFESETEMINHHRRKSKQIIPNE